MNPNIFRIPAPYSEFNLPRQKTPHFMTSEGLMMPKHLQPPPMYGPRGATIPPKYLATKKETNSEQEEQDFFCELCDYDFTSKADYRKHVSEHRPCTVDGCKFVGHPDILAKHIEQQHKSGLFDKLKNINTPEEVIKWREERKKRYPTQTNVALRQQLQAERFRRGERLDENKSRFGQRQDRNKCRQHEPSNVKGSKFKRQRIPRRTKPDFSHRKEGAESDGKQKPEADPDSDSEIKKFKGTSQLLDYERPPTKSKSDNALASLAGLYGSDDDVSSNEGSDQEAGEDHESKTKREVSRFNISSDEDDHCQHQPERVDILSVLTANTNFGSLSTDCSNPTAEDEPKVDNPNTIKDNTSPPKDIPPPQDSKPAESASTIDASENPKAESDDDDQQVEVPFTKVVETFPPEEEKQESNVNVPNRQQKNARKRNRRQPKDTEKSGATSVAENKKKKKLVSGLVYSRLYRRPQNTMLEKLLQPDIVHERNVLLQCVRYVVDNDFFGIGQPKETL